MPTTVLVNPYRFSISATNAEAGVATATGVANNATAASGIKAGSFRSRATTGVDTVSGMTFTPKAVLLSVVTADFSDTALTAGIQSCIAVSDGTTTRSSALQDSDNVGTTTTARGWTSTIRTIDSAGATVAEGTLALTSDGFTINWTTISASVTVTYWAIGGASISAKVLLFNRSTTGTASVTGAGFQPKALVAIGAGSADADTTTNGLAFSMIGIVDDDVDQLGCGVTMEDAATAANTSRVSGTAAALRRRNESDSASDTVIAITSLDADGFSYNASTHPGSSRYYAVLCLGGVGIVASNVETLTADATTGAHTQTMSGLAFNPDGGVLIGIGATTTSNATTARLTVGAFDANFGQAGTLLNSNDTSDPTVTSEGASSTSAIIGYSGTDDVLKAVGEITAKTSSTIDVAWDASKTATQFLWYGLMLDLAA